MTTTTESSGSSQVTTKKSESEATTTQSGMETTTEESGMGSTTHSQKKRRTTTTESSGGTDSSTEGNKDTTEPATSEGTPGNGEGEDEDTDTDNCDGQDTADGGEGTCTTERGDEDMTTSKTTEHQTTTDEDSESSEGPSGMETTSEHSGMGSTTHRQKKRRSTTTKSSGGPDSSTEELGPELTTDSSMTTRRHKKRRTTTTKSSGESDSSTEGSEMTIEGSEPESTTEECEMEKTTNESSGETDSSIEDMTTTKEDSRSSEGPSEMETTTEVSGMGSTTHRQKKRRSTTTKSSGGADSSTEGNKDTTEPATSEGTPGNGEGEDEDTDTDNCDGQDTADGGEGTCTTEGGDEDMTTTKTTQHQTTTDEDSESSEGPSGMETTSEHSGMGSTTHRQKKRRSTTTKSSGGPDSSTEELGPELTTDSSMTTHRQKKHRTSTTASSGRSDSSTEEPEMTTEESGGEMNTSGSGMDTTTRRHKKRRTTTTESSGGPDSSTEESESELTTDSSMTTRRHRKRRTTTTKSSGGPDSSTVIDTTTEVSTTSTNDSRYTATDSSMTTTDVPTTTIKGPKDCNGRHEWYFICAPSCPQRTCAEYLNGVRCPITVGKITCTPECRCLIGYYKDEEGNCLSTWECRRRLRPTPTAMTSSTTTANPDNQDNKTSSSTTMMSTTPPPNCEDVAYELFVTGNLAYTTRILADLIERNPGNSIVVGGASILFLFAQLVLEAKGKVKTEILNVLNLRETEQMCQCGGQPNLSSLLMAAFKQDIVLEQIRCFFPKISAELTASYSDIQFSLFCKIYADVDYALTGDYVQRTAQLFAIGPENVDFSSPTAAEKINSDVAAYTNDIFEKFVKPITLSPLEGMILVDAEDFQGKWEKQFNPANTIKRNFHRLGRIDRVPTMYTKGWFLYTDSFLLDAKILKLHYVGSRFALAIILPNMYDGIGDLIRRMRNPESIKQAFDSLKYGNVEIYLPTFNISVANRLKISSEMANIRESFNNSTTGFEDIGSNKLLYVSEILQRINYQVNEYGMGDKLQPEFTLHTPVSKVVTSNLFRADHPFLYMLCFDKIVLQAGLCA